MTNGSDAIDIRLSAEDAVDEGLETAPKDRHFGSEPEITEADQVFIRIGSRPRAWNLSALYAEQHNELPPDLAILSGGYEIWLVRNSVSYMHEPGSRDVRRLGLEIRYADESDVSIAEVFPKTTLLNLFTGKITTNLTASIDFGGHLAATSTVPATAGIPVELGGGAKLDVSAKAEFLGTISMSLVTPVIEAVGDGDSFAQWVLTRHEQPLWGDHGFYQVLLIPPGVRALTYDARVSARVTRYGLVESVRRSKWIPLKCELVTAKAVASGNSG